MPSFEVQPDLQTKTYTLIVKRDDGSIEKKPGYEQERNAVYAGQQRTDQIRHRRTR